MRPLYTFTVKPTLPPQLERLRELAGNLRWSWDHELIALFRRIDEDLWEETGHNPVMMLGLIPQQRFEELATDDSFLNQLRRAGQRFDEYMTSSKWYDKLCDQGYVDPLIAYFSLEYGITESLQIYNGGLGILAADHLKSSSDLGVPVVGMGMLYQEGFFQQQLNADGWQQESYPQNDFYNLPLTLERDEQGAPLTIRVAYPGREVYAQIWRADVGRVALYLLDTNIEVNTREDQDITDQLYGGDLEMRLKQEMMLGIGGVRALQLLGHQPPLYHMNEGHTAFLSLERARMLMERFKLSFDEAKELARAGGIFTTHTPVPAGIDYFPSDLIGRYFGEYYRRLGLDHDRFMALGRQNPRDNYEPFCMAILAMRMAAYTNGVSELHGQVSRRMWQGVWPGVPVEEVPVGHVTNGMHQPSFISRDMAAVYDLYLGPRWRTVPADAEVWSRVDRIPSAELWNTHERRRERLVSFVRHQLRQQLERRGAPHAEVMAADEVLNPEALTIGFARRFATYKRATLLLRDPERLIQILCDRDRPVQIIFAGKAHPHDNPGKELIRRIVHMARREELRPRLVFLENYDINIARYLLQGVDVWLNTPLRPHEASGTSGMKAAANGVLNCSILDGWWNEAYTPEIGWAIGRGEDYDDRNLQDHVESNALYSLLEQEIVPLFYDRSTDGLPRKWIDKMKALIKATGPIFNSHRMLQEYTEKYYLPAYERFQRLDGGSTAQVKEYAAWKRRMQESWPQVRVERIEAQIPSETQVGVANAVEAQIRLGSLEPEDVKVQLYYGQIDAGGEILLPRIVEMDSATLADGTTDGVYTFAGSLSFNSSGKHGFTVRVLPSHPEQVNPFETGLIQWG
ncbi:MAG: alpha-glucan family phosphorylase [Anaerolineae bacterium]